jgi:hypothetical protein
MTLIHAIGAQIAYQDATPLQNTVANDDRPTIRKDDTHVQKVLTASHSRADSM